jgi:rod shape determining protein RodA
MFTKPDKRFWKNFDWLFAMAILLLLAAGFINMYSASHAAGHASFQWKQLAWYGLGIMVMAAMLFFDYRILALWHIHIYVILVLLLVAVLFVGKSAGGAQRWLPLGFMNLQPSEFAKLTMTIVIASWFSYNYKPTYGLFDLWQPVGLTLVPVALIYLEPDLGTAVFLVIILGSIVYVAHLRWTAFLTVVGLVMSMLPLAWKLMHDYQKKRVLTFLNPESDPQGSGYHVIQSKIAIGSGQLFGKGYMHGTQAHLKFLPEVHTDFAFSIWCEEWGFAGAALLLLIFCFMLARGIRIAANSKDVLGTYLAFGITAMLFWQALINICMVIGLMPVVGIPLPFISYGGSSVITSMAGAGIILNISGRRFMFQKDRKGNKLA